VAVLFSRTGDMTATREHLQQALRLDPQHDAARRALDQLTAAGR
jgi:Tfp pilus assembly protein PilF